MPEKELAKIAGGENVLDEPEALKRYAGDLSFAPEVMPRCVVRPGNIDEVQAIVRWANEALVPLIPLSSGFPHSRGDTVPGAAGAVIIDLGRMKRIIRIDPRNKVAMVEPGVTFNELQEALEKEGLSAYLPLAPRVSKSVIGSMLEREPVTMPAYHWDSTDPLLCAEVVFGTGDKFRTGEASGPDTIEEQWELGKAQMNPFGHSHLDVQRLLTGAQGTIGIVTWATLKCRFLSSSSRAFLVPSDRLEPLVDLSYKLLRIRLGGHQFILNGLNLACLLRQASGDIRGLRASLPPWVMFVSFEGYGPLPEDKLLYEVADFTDMARACGLEPAEAVSGADAAELSGLLSRSWPEPYWKSALKGGFQDIFFLTTLDKTAEFAGAMPDLAAWQKYPAEDIGVYIQPVVQGTSCHCEFNLYYDPREAAESEAARRLMAEGSSKLEGMGAFFSRPYQAWQDVAYRRAEGTRAMQRKVKEIFDPNAILNPGKLCF